MRELGLVFLNNVADFIEQWMQILFVLLPAPGCRGRVDRLAHLRGACRTYRPVGIVEIETAFVPFETEIGDQFLGLPLDIGNIVLVPDLEHRIRKFTAPMLHQLPVAPIVAAKLAQVVGPDLTLCKVDPVTGQTGFDRMPTAVDDSRLGQDRVDQADHREVARHLVDDAFVRRWRSEEHTSELQSLMRISYAVFCLKKKKEI